MRAKYAAQIRFGIEQAKRHVSVAQEVGRVPSAWTTPLTELEQRAYDRTLPREVARVVVASGERMVAKVKAAFPPSYKPADDPAGRIRVDFLNGPYRGVSAHLIRTPNKIRIGGYTYTLVRDPDTGESLGAYAIEGAE